MVIALPNELADKNKNQTSAEQKIILKDICDELVNQIEVKDTITSMRCIGTMTVPTYMYISFILKERSFRQSQRDIKRYMAG